MEVIQANKENIESVSSSSPTPGSLGVSSEIEDLGETEQSRLKNLTQCGVCKESFKNPRILECLHIFCEACLEKLLHSSVDKSKYHLTIYIKLTNYFPGTITCVFCGTVTDMKDRGVHDLDFDYLAHRLAEGRNAGPVISTCCKSKEPSVGHCRDCMNYLCAKCVEAHESMLCFEAHHVTRLDRSSTSSTNGCDELPLLSQQHSNQCLKFYCCQCHIAFCNQCPDHQMQGHICQPIGQISEAMRSQIVRIVEKSNERKDECEETENQLAQYLQQLQEQRDNIKSQIQETLNSCRAVLQRVADSSLSKLEEYKIMEEDKILEAMEEMKRVSNIIEESCVYANRLLKHGSTNECAVLYRPIERCLIANWNKIFPAEHFQPQLRYIPAEIDKVEQTLSSVFGRVATSSVGPASVVSDIDSGAVRASPASGVAQLTGNTGSAFEQVVSTLPINVGTIDTIVNEMNGNHDIFKKTAAEILEIPTSSSNGNGYSNGVDSNGFSSHHFSQQQAVQQTRSADGNPVLNGALEGLASQLVQTCGESASAFSSYTSNSNGIHNAIQSPQRPQPLRSPDLNDQIIPLANELSQLPNGNYSPIPSMGGRMLSSNSNAMLNNMPRPVAASQFPASPPPFSTMSSSSNNGTTLQSWVSSSAAVINGSTGAPGDMSPTPNDHSSTSPPFPGSSRTNRNVSPMQIRVKFGQLGPGRGQFNSPHGFCLGENEDIIVADTNSMYLTYHF